MAWPGLIPGERAMRVVAVGIVIIAFLIGVALAVAVPAGSVAHDGLQTMPSCRGRERPTRRHLDDRTVSKALGQQSHLICGELGAAKGPNELPFKTL